MAPLTLKDFQELFAAIDVETTRIADYIAELLAKIAAGGLSPAEEAEVQKLVAGELDKLRSLGTTTTPVPVPGEGGGEGGGETPAEPGTEP